MFKVTWAKLCGWMAQMILGHGVRPGRDARACRRVRGHVHGVCVCANTHRCVHGVIRTRACVDAYIAHADTSTIWLQCMYRLRTGWTLWMIVDHVAELYERSHATKSKGQATKKGGHATKSKGEATKKGGHATKNKGQTTKNKGHATKRGRMQRNMGGYDQQRTLYMFHSFFSLVFFFSSSLSHSLGKNDLSYSYRTTPYMVGASFLSRIISHIHIGPLLTWWWAPFFQEWSFIFISNPL